MRQSVKKPMIWDNWVILLSMCFIGMFFRNMDIKGKVILWISIMTSISVGLSLIGVAYLNSMHPLQADFSSLRFLSIWKALVSVSGGYARKLRHIPHHKYALTGTSLTMRPLGCIIYCACNHHLVDKYYFLYHLHVENSWYMLYQNQLYLCLKQRCVPVSHIILTNTQLTPIYTNNNIRGVSRISSWRGRGGRNRRPPGLKYWWGVLYR